MTKIRLMFQVALIALLFIIASTGAAVLGTSLGKNMSIHMVLIEMQAEANHCQQNSESFLSCLNIRY